jgi:hypothetical protein
MQEPSKDEIFMRSDSPWYPVSNLSLGKLRDTNARKRRVKPRGYTLQVLQGDHGFDLTRTGQQYKLYLGKIPSVWCKKELSDHDWIYEGEF